MPEGSSERGRDALAQLIGLVQVAEHIDQTHDRTDDAHGRRVAAAGREHGELALVALGHSSHIGFHDFAHQLWIGAVDNQQHAFFDGRIVDFGGLALESQQTLATGTLGEAIFSKTSR